MKITREREYRCAEEDDDEEETDEPDNDPDTEKDETIDGKPRPTVESYRCSSDDEEETVSAEIGGTTYEAPVHETDEGTKYTRAEEIIEKKDDED